MNDANPAARWTELKKAVREAAHTFRAEFRILGADVEISGELPAELRSQLPTDLLWSYLGAEGPDADAQRYADRIGIVPIHVSDAAGFAAALAELSGAQYIGLDIETGVPGTIPAPITINKDGSVAANQLKPNDAALDPLRAAIQTVQLCADGERVFVFTGDALSELLAIRWLDQQHLIVHNALFETAFLQRHTGFASTIQCTMQAGGLIYGGSRGLDKVCAKARLPEPPKVLGTSYWAAPRLSRGQICYAATDAALAWYLWTDMQDRLPAVYALQRDAIPAVAAMQLRGLGFGPAAHARQVEAWSWDLYNARTAYREMTGNPAPETPDQIRALIPELAGDRLMGWARTNMTGELSISGKYLKRLVSIPAAKPLLEIIKTKKLLANFGPRLGQFVNPHSGRLHASYNVCGSKSGRFTCSRPNLQQLPSKTSPGFRECISAGNGRLLVSGDWSQIELRVAAWFFEDPELTAAFAAGRDLHAETAARIAGIPPEKVSPEQRQSAKAVNFGAIYGIGAQSLMISAFENYGVEMSLDDARQALNRFNQAYVTLRRNQERHANLCQSRGYVDIAGRRVWARDEPGGFLSYNQCCNLPVQGIAANAMLREIPLVDRRLAGLNAGLVASVHDELVVEVLKHDATAVASILAETMTQAFAETCPGAPLNNIVEVAIGETWCEAKP